MRREQAIDKGNAECVKSGMDGLVGRWVSVYLSCRWRNLMGLTGTEPVHNGAVGASACYDAAALSASRRGRGLFIPARAGMQAAVVAAAAETLCPGGGMGRHRRLKISRLYGCAGSSPAPGTITAFALYSYNFKPRYAYNYSCVGHRYSPLNDLRKISLMNAGVPR